MLYGYDDWDGVQYDTFYDPSPFSWDDPYDAYLAFLREQENARRMEQRRNATGRDDGTGRDHTTQQERVNNAAVAD